MPACGCRQGSHRPIPKMHTPTNLLPPLHAPPFSVCAGQPAPTPVPALPWLLAGALPLPSNPNPKPLRQALCSSLAYGLTGLLGLLSVTLGLSVAGIYTGLALLAVGGEGVYILSFPCCRVAACV